MPQEFQVLCCYSCKVYQVHQIKKSNKWNCKVCNEKQSVKQVYGKGNGKECREHVQKFNMLASLKDSIEPEQTPDVEYCSPPVEQQNLSKWSNFLDEISKDDSDDDDDYTSVVRRRKWNSTSPGTNKKFKRFQPDADIPTGSQHLESSENSDRRHSQSASNQHSSKWDMFT